MHRRRHGGGGALRGDSLSGIARGLAWKWAWAGATIVALAACKTTPAVADAAGLAKVEDAAAARAGLADAPSRQSVRFHLAPSLLGGDAGRHALVEGFAIQRLVADKPPEKLVLEKPIDCPCGCPQSADGAVPPPSHDFPIEQTWDARTYVARGYTTMCGAEEKTSGVESALQPVTPGHYRATFLVVKCDAGGDGGAGCGKGSPKPLTIEFDVPATGDVDVPVR